MQIKYRYVYVIPDRHGTQRIYFWRGKGHRRVRLREEPGSGAFQARYDELLRGVKIGSLERPTERTLSWLCAAYVTSPEFQRLELSTQKERRLILMSMCTEPIAPGVSEVFADFPLDRLSTKAVRVLRDRKGHSPFAANKRVKVLRYLFKWAIESEHIASNPASDVTLLRTPAGGHHAWTLEELEKFERHHPMGSKARLALDLLIYTGARRSDVVRLGRQHIRKGWLHFTQLKTKMSVELPVLPALQRTIDASPTGDLTFLVTDGGKPFTAEGFATGFVSGATKRVL
jgi:integrase